MATADPDTLPDKATWYLATDLPRPGSPRTADSPHPASLAELVRLYGLRHWIEQSHKQIKDGSSGHVILRAAATDPSPASEGGGQDSAGQNGGQGSSGQGGFGQGAHAQDQLSRTGATTLPMAFLAAGALTAGLAAVAAPRRARD